MKFGRVPVAEAAGTLLAHALYAGDRLFKKGHVLSVADLGVLAAAGHHEVAGVQLEAGDLAEDAAALEVARGLVGPGVRLAPAGLGRVNLVATTAGLFTIEPAAVNLWNAAEERVTLATLPTASRVESGTLVATVKVIPFALPAATVAQVSHLTTVTPGARATVHPWSGVRAGLVLTRFPRTGSAGLDKAAELQRARLVKLGGTLGAERRVAHEESAVATALSELHGLGLSPLLVLGASATADRDDVLPTALQSLGGEVERLGLPVDPGNLLMLGRLGDVTVVGVPACARAPRRSGFDLVLERLAAGLPLTAAELGGWGVGGLLAEAPRPVPRRARERPAVAALVLAAGGSTRMGDRHKLTASLGDRPLVAHAVDTVLASRARPVVVVTGHQAEAVRASLGGREVTFVANPEWSTGLASSLRAGLAGLPQAVDGVLVCLGDMPRIRAATLDALLDAFTGPQSIVTPEYLGRRGHPVLFGRGHFAELARTTGDVGARALLERHAPRAVPVADPGVLVDVDTPADLSALCAPEC
jgi:molybdenum cofactor cytidylyltransferase